MRSPCSLLLVASAAAATPKHILFFVIDDYGFADASYKSEMYNGTNPPPTPTLDALAHAGVRLESHYANKLCSPTRTALLSGRYAYTNGMDDGVIIDGQNIDMPLNLLTIADHLQQAGWKTSAYGKWDAGMTTWGSTPACRGFDYFNGFYSAASDYFTHMVGPGFDYHCDSAQTKEPDFDASTVYTTHKVTSAVQTWIKAQMANAGESEVKTFAYVAHEAVHGPLEAPLSYVEGACEALIPADHPARRIYCGMVRAMDESVKNITDTYRDLGILDDTVIVLTGDNGGQPKVGGNNHPLRGCKATTFEGGLRSLAFISGAGLETAVQGTVSQEMMHVTDWLPTLVQGVAGLSLNATGRPCATCTRPVAPLDGVNQWPMLTAGTPSARTEVLLDLQATACIHDVCDVPGSGAIRMGKWKLLHGHQSVYGLKSNCLARDTAFANAKTFPFPVPANETDAWCPLGWTPPPKMQGYELPTPPPNAGCTTLPCVVPGTSPYLSGGTLLFDVVLDPFEHNDVATQNPTVVAKLLARLQEFNTTHCGGQRCLPDDAGGPKGVPVTVPKHTGKVWKPWRGNPDPTKCDTDRIVAGALVKSSLDTPHWVTASPPVLTMNGWAWDGAWDGGGVPPMVVRVSVDGVEVGEVIANISRAALPAKTGAPNPDHGFTYTLGGAAAEKLAGAGSHRLDVEVYLAQAPMPAGTPLMSVTNSPACFSDGKRAACYLDQM